MKTGFRVSYRCPERSKGDIRAVWRQEVPRTTKLYDRTGDEVALGDAEWIAI
jgi:hypothetical protein